MVTATMTTITRLRRQRQQQQQQRRQRWQRYNRCWQQFKANLPSNPILRMLSVADVRLGFQAIL